MRASEFLNEAMDSDAVNELDSYIMNTEELYRRRFMPIIANLRRKMKKNIYDHEKAQKLWMYMVDDAAREYVQQFGSQGQGFSGGINVEDIFNSVFGGGGGFGDIFGNSECLILSNFNT